MPPFPPWPRRAALAVLAAVVALAGCASGTSAAPEADVLRLGHSLSADHPVHLAMVAMAGRLDSLSDGRMRMVVYPSGQLGSERESLELLQVGSLSMTKVSTSTLESFAPEFAVFSTPYLFRDDGHRFAVLDGPTGRALLSRAEPFRLRGLVYYDAGARSFYTVDQAARSPSDLAGLKIRVQESPSAVALVRALGASPTPVSWGELYTALQQGVVDGAENNPPSFHLSRHYEVARHYVLNEHSAIPDILVIGTPTWDRLSQQERQWLQDAADYSAGVQRRLWATATDEALQAIKAAGVEVVRLSPDERAAFVEAVRPVKARVRADPALSPVLGRIEAEGRPLAEGGP